MPMNALFPNYARMPIHFEHGAGVWLWDTKEQRYLDALSGIAVCSLGHAHPAVSEAIMQQSKKLLHTSNLYHIGVQETLAKQLTHIAGMDAAFFCNSGTEACEAAIKLARLHAHQQGNKLPQIIVMENAFHGRTLGSLAASDLPADSFAPLPTGFIRAPFGDIQALQQILATNSAVCAVMTEPIQGEGGVNIPTADYLPMLRQLCDEHGVLLILDEIQTGIGRTGRWFCFQHSHCQPDILTVAKALGNGMPIGACLAKQSIADQFVPGTHGSTFGGNFLACAASLAVLRTIEENNLCEYAAKIGEYLLHSLQAELGSLTAVKEIRGQGLMIGIELDRSCKLLQTQALEEGILINVTAEKVIRLLPPLIFEEAHANQLTATLYKLIKRFIQ